MRTKIAFITAIALLFSGGCGAVALMSTPTRNEKKIPAEFDLALYKDAKIVVLVENPVWVNAPFSLTMKIAENLDGNLVQNLELESSNIVSGEAVQTFRATHPLASNFSPAEVGQFFKAGMVLFVELHKYTLTKVTETDYYKGELGGRAALFDCASGQRLWPASEQGKVIRVGFDVEEGDYTAANDRLARAFAHCVTRYLYNCPVPKFKTSDDRSGTGWENWQD